MSSVYLVLYVEKLGHLACKIVSKMTYNVSNGTLNPTIPFLTANNQSFIRRHFPMLMFSSALVHFLLTCLDLHIVYLEHNSRT